MKFLIDEDISPKIANLLNELGYPATHIREVQISLSDQEILKIATTGQFIVITEDKDFGKLVFKEGQLHNGVIFLRLEDQTLGNTKKAIKWVLSKGKNKLKSNFTTVTEKKGELRVRFKEKKSTNHS